MMYLFIGFMFWLLGCEIGYSILLHTQIKRLYKDIESLREYMHIRIAQSETSIVIKIKSDVQDWLTSMGGIGIQAKLGLVSAPDCVHEWEEWPNGQKHCVACGIVRVKL